MKQQEIAQRAKDIQKELTNTLTAMQEMSQKQVHEAAEKVKYDLQKRLLDAKKEFEQQQKKYKEDLAAQLVINEKEKQKFQLQQAELKKKANDFAKKQMDKFAKEHKEALQKQKQMQEDAMKESLADLMKQQLEKHKLDMKMHEEQFK